VSVEFDMLRAELLQKEHEQRREERVLRMRAELGVPLRYEEIEILTGVPYSTLSNWRSQGRMDPVDPDARPPRFLFSDVLRILGAARGSATNTTWT